MTREMPIRQPGKGRGAGGVIRAGEIYTQDEFLRLVGWTRAALSTARRQGLRVIMAGSKNFIRGADWDSYLLHLATEKRAEP